MIFNPIGVDAIIVLRYPHVSPEVIMIEALRASGLMQVLTLSILRFHRRIP